jgi:long-subunit fatty acid transport protein
VGQEKTGGQAPETAPGQAPDQQPPGPASTSEEQAAPEQKAPEKVLEASEEEKKRTVSTAVEQTGYTLIRGRLEIDSVLNYTHSSSNQLLIEGFGILPILTIGNISVQRIRRDTWTASFSARYKLTPGMDVSVTVPYSYSLTRISEATGIQGGSVVTPNTDNLNRGWGLGDVSGGLSYQLLTEGTVRPAIYVGVSFRGRTGRDSFETNNPAQNAPTGSGFNILGVSANFVKVADPAVVSGSFVYGHPFSRNNVVFENQGNPVQIDVDPGDSYSASLGLAYALNYKVSLSTTISQAVGLPTYINGTKLNNSLSNAITLGYGLTWRWSEKTSLGISVTQGLTLDTPDVSVGFRIPYRF